MKVEVVVVVVVVVDTHSIHSCIKGQLTANYKHIVCEYFNRMCVCAFSCLRTHYYMLSRIHRERDRGFLLH